MVPEKAGLRAGQKEFPAVLSVFLKGRESRLSLIGFPFPLKGSKAAKLNHRHWRSEASKHLPSPEHLPSQSDRHHSLLHTQLRLSCTSLQQVEPWTASCKNCHIVKGVSHVRVGLAQSSLPDLQGLLVVFQRQLVL